MMACSGGKDGNTSSSTAALKVPQPDAGDADAADAAKTNNPPLTASYTAGSFVDITNLTSGTTGAVVGGGDASPWIIGASGSVYHYSNDAAGARTWLPEPNSPNTKSLAVSPEGIPWRIDTAHHIFFHTGANGSGTWCQANAAAQAYEVSVGPNYDAWAIGISGCNGNGDCPIWRWSGSSSCTNGVSTGTWSQPTPNSYAQHITVAPDDSTAYVSNSWGGMWKFVNGGWGQGWPGTGCIRNPSTGYQFDSGLPVIAAAANDTVWVLGCEGGTQAKVWAWHDDGSYWENVPGNAASISVTADGTPWIIDSSSSKHIYEYGSTWQSVGPNGFSYTPECDGQHCDGACDPNTQVCPEEILTGEIQDIAVALTTVGGNQGEGVTIGATTGGVWQTPPTLGWIPIGDVGAGVNAVSGPNAVNGPSYTIGSVTVKPGTGDENTVVVGTGVAANPNSYANSLPGGGSPVSNGIWVGRANVGGGGTFTWGGASHQPALMVDPSGLPVYPPAIVKVRYSRDAAKIYAITPTALFVSVDDGATFNESADPSCVPSGQDVFTDLVVDPQDSNVAYVGVSGEGVYQAEYHVFGGALNCDHGSAPPLRQAAPPSTITSVALAINNSSLLYAAFAGNPDTGPPLNDPGDNFANVDATSTGTWAAGWTTPIPADSVPPSLYYGLNSQGAHDWALATNASGDVILLGGKALHRWTGCSASGCGQTVIPCAQDWNSTPLCPDHHDYHSITWGDVAPYDHWVYAVNDGGVFVSMDDGLTWQAQDNSLAVANTLSVAVAGSNLYANAWDVGGSFSFNGGTSWNGDHLISGEIDGAQAAADPSHGYGFMCMNTSHRFTSESGAWQDKDTAPAQAAPNCYMAMGRFGSLFTTASMSGQDNILASSNYGSNWSFYHSNLQEGPPWGLVVSNENPPTVYAFNGAPGGPGQSYLMVSVNNQDWTLPATVPSWPAGYQFIGTGAGPAASTDWSTGDLYVVGSNVFADAPVVLMSPVTSHGTSWIQLTGTNTSGTPAMLKQDERVTTLGVDASARAVIVGTDGASEASTVYGPASVWRLNNSGVADSSHHWRPWVDGLPIGTLPIGQITGQYENGVYYFYAASWGRGIWKREARGGDL